MLISDWVSVLGSVGKRISINQNIVSVCHYWFVEVLCKCEVQNVNPGTSH